MRSENLKSIVAAGSVGMAVVAERAGAFSALPNGFFAKEGALLGGVAVGDWLGRRSEFDPLFDKEDRSVNTGKVVKGLIAGLGALGMKHGMEPAVANALFGVGVTSITYPIFAAPEKIGDIYSSVKENVAERKKRRANKKNEEKKEEKKEEK